MFCDRLFEFIGNDELCHVPRNIWASSCDVPRNVFEERSFLACCHPDNRFVVLDNVTRPKGRVESHRILRKLVSLSLSEFTLVIEKACVKPVDNKIDLIGEEDLAVAPLAAAYERLCVPPRFDICD